MAKKKILIAENDKMTLNLYKIQFGNEENWDLILVDNGRKALDYLEVAKPDLIMLDIVMPEVGGVEVFKQIRQKDHLKDVPVIFVTNLNSDEALVKEGIALGVTDYMVKSDTSLKQIAAKIHGILGE